MADPPVPGKPSFNIPKIKRQEHKDGLRNVECNSRDAREVTSTVEHSFLDRTYPSPWKPRKIQMVNNKELESQYRAKKAIMKEEGRHAREMQDHYAFVLVKDIMTLGKIAKEGFKTRLIGFNSLGDSKVGVYVCKHADMQLQLAESWRVETCHLVVCKVTYGKCKAVPMQTKSDNKMEPTPNFDCHTSQERPQPNDPFNQQLSRSMMYLYEYNDDCEPVDRPRHCVPYAFVTYEKTKNRKSNADNKPIHWSSKSKAPAPPTRQVTGNEAIRKSNREAFEKRIAEQQVPPTMNYLAIPPVDKRFGYFQGMPPGLSPASMILPYQVKHSRSDPRLRKISQESDDSSVSKHSDEQDHVAYSPSKDSDSTSFSIPTPERELEESIIRSFSIPTPERELEESIIRASFSKTERDLEESIIRASFSKTEPSSHSDTKEEVLPTKIIDSDSEVTQKSTEQTKPISNDPKSLADKKDEIQAVVKHLEAVLKKKEEDLKNIEESIKQSTLKEKDDINESNNLNIVDDQRPPHCVQENSQIEDIDERVHHVHQSINMNLVVNEMGDIDERRMPSIMQRNTANLNFANAFGFGPEIHTPGISNSFNKKTFSEDNMMEEPMELDSDTESTPLKDTNMTMVYAQKNTDQSSPKGKTGKKVSLADYKARRKANSPIRSSVNQQDTVPVIKISDESESQITKSVSEMHGNTFENQETISTRKHHLSAMSGVPKLVLPPTNQGDSQAKFYNEQGQYTDTNDTLTPPTSFSTSSLSPGASNNPNFGNFLQKVNLDISNLKNILQNISDSPTSSPKESPDKLWNSAYEDVPWMQLREVKRQLSFEERQAELRYDAYNLSNSKEEKTEEDDDESDYTALVAKIKNLQQEIDQIKKTEKEMKSPNSSAVDKSPVPEWPSPLKQLKEIVDKKKETEKKQEQMVVEKRGADILDDLSFFTQKETDKEIIDLSEENTDVIPGFGFSDESQLKGMQESVDLESDVSNVNNRDFYNETIHVIDSETEECADIEPCPELGQEVADNNMNPSTKEQTGDLSCESENDDGLVICEPSSDNLTEDEKNTSVAHSKISDEIPVKKGFYTDTLIMEKTIEKQQESPESVQKAFHFQSYSDNIAAVTNRDIFVKPLLTPTKTSHEIKSVITEKDPSDSEKEMGYISCDGSYISDIEGAVKPVVNSIHDISYTENKAKPVLNSINDTENIATVNTVGDRQLSNIDTTSSEVDSAVKQAKNPYPLQSLPASMTTNTVKTASPYKLPIRVEKVSKESASDHKEADGGTNGSTSVEILAKKPASAGSSPESQKQEIKKQQKKKYLMKKKKEMAGYTRKRRRKKKNTEDVDEKSVTSSELLDLSESVSLDRFSGAFSNLTRASSSDCSSQKLQALLQDLGVHHWKDALKIKALQPVVLLKKCDDNTSMPITVESLAKTTNMSHKSEHLPDVDSRFPQHKDEMVKQWIEGTRKKIKLTLKDQKNDILEAQPISVIQRDFKQQALPNTTEKKKTDLQQKPMEVSENLKSRVQPVVRNISPITVISSKMVSLPMSTAPEPPKNFHTVNSTVHTSIQQQYIASPSATVLLNTPKVSMQQTPLTMVQNIPMVAHPPLQSQPYLASYSTGQQLPHTAVPVYYQRPQTTPISVKQPHTSIHVTVASQMNAHHVYPTSQLPHPSVIGQTPVGQAHIPPIVHPTASAQRPQNPILINNQGISKRTPITAPSHLTGNPIPTVGVKSSTHITVASITPQVEASPNRRVITSASLRTPPTSKSANSQFPPSFQHIPAVNNAATPIRYQTPCNIPRHATTFAQQTSQYASPIHPSIRPPSLQFNYNSQIPPRVQPQIQPTPPGTSAYPSGFSKPVHEPEQDKHSTTRRKSTDVMDWFADKFAPKKRTKEYHSSSDSYSDTDSRSTRSRTPLSDSYSDPSLSPSPQKKKTQSFLGDGCQPKRAGRTDKDNNRQESSFNETENANNATKETNNENKMETDKSGVDISVPNDDVEITKIERKANVTEESSSYSSFPLQKDREKISMESVTSTENMPIQNGNDKYDRSVVIVSKLRVEAEIADTPASPEHDSPLSPQDNEVIEICVSPVQIDCCDLNDVQDIDCLAKRKELLLKELDNLGYPADSPSNVRCVQLQKPCIEISDDDLEEGEIADENASLGLHENHNRRVVVRDDEPQCDSRIVIAVDKEENEQDHIINKYDGDISVTVNSDGKVVHTKENNLKKNTKSTNHSSISSKGNDSVEPSQRKSLVDTIQKAKISKGDVQSVDNNGKRITENSCTVKDNVSTNINEGRSSFSDRNVDEQNTRRRRSSDSQSSVEDSRHRRKTDEYDRRSYSYDRSRKRYRRYSRSRRRSSDSSRSSTDSTSSDDFHDRKRNRHYANRSKYCYEYDRYYSSRQKSRRHRRSSESASSSEEYSRRNKSKFYSEKSEIKRQQERKKEEYGAMIKSRNMHLLDLQYDRKRSGYSMSSSDEKSSPYKAASRERSTYEKDNTKPADIAADRVNTSSKKHFTKAANAWTEMLCTKPTNLERIKGDKVDDDYIDYVKLAESVGPRMKGNTGYKNNALTPRDTLRKWLTDEYDISQTLLKDLERHLTVDLNQIIQHMSKSQRKNIKAKLRKEMDIALEKEKTTVNVNPSAGASQIVTNDPSALVIKQYEPINFTKSSIGKECEIVRDHLRKLWDSTQDLIDGDGVGGQSQSNSGSNLNKSAHLFSIRQDMQQLEMDLVQRINNYGVHYGVPNRRVPNELLLDVEKSGHLSNEELVLILSGTIPAKAYQKLLLMRQKIEHADLQIKKTEVLQNKEELNRLKQTKNDLHKNRKAMMLTFTGPLSKKRINKVRTKAKCYRNCIDYFKKELGVFEAEIRLRFLMVCMQDLDRHFSIISQLQEDQEKKRLEEVAQHVHLRKRRAMVNNFKENFKLVDNQLTTMHVQYRSNPSVCSAITAVLSMIKEALTLIEAERDSKNISVNTVTRLEQILQSSLLGYDNVKQQIGIANVHTQR